MVSCIKFKEVFCNYLIKCYHFPCYFSDKKSFSIVLIYQFHKILINPINSTFKIHYKYDHTQLLNFFLLH